MDTAIWSRNFLKQGSTSAFGPKDSLPPFAIHILNPLDKDDSNSTGQKLSKSPFRYPFLRYYGRFLSFSEIVHGKISDFDFLSVLGGCFALNHIKRHKYT